MSMTLGSIGCCAASNSNLLNIPELFLKDFVIYSYQFAHLNDEPNLFIDIQKRNNELMENSIEGI